MCLPLWLRGRLSVKNQPEDVVVNINNVLAPEEPNVYRLRDNNCLALQRSAMYWWMSSSNHIFRSAGAKNFIGSGSL
jgi:hypothetical protein